MKRIFKTLMLSGTLLAVPTIAMSCSSVSGKQKKAARLQAEVGRGTYEENLREIIKSRENFKTDAEYEAFLDTIIQFHTHP